MVERSWWGLWWFLWWCLVAVLIFVGHAHAELIVCGDATQFRRIYFADPTQVSAGCTVFPKPTNQAERDAMQAQISLVQSFAQAGTLRYLKVVNGLAVEMTQSEKDAVDAAIATQETVQQGYLDELTNNTLCNTMTLSDITTRINNARDAIQTDINATTSVATAKTAMTTMNNTYAAALRQIARCLVARRFSR